MRKLPLIFFSLYLALTSTILADTFGKKLKVRNPDNSVLVLGVDEIIFSEVTDNLDGSVSVNVTESDPDSLHLDQSSPQTLSASPVLNWGTQNRIPYFSSTKTLIDSSLFTYDGSTFQVKSPATSWTSPLQVVDAANNLSVYVLHGVDGIGGGLILNNNKVDFSLRVAGVTDEGLLYTDSTDNRVGIGNIDPQSKLDVTGVIKGQGLSLVPVAAGTQFVITDTATAYMFSTYTGGAGYAAGGAVVVNDIGVGMDFRVETDSQENALLIDGANNKAVLNVPLYFGSNQISSGSLLDGTKLADADLGEVRSKSGVLTVERTVVIPVQNTSDVLTTDDTNSWTVPSEFNGYDIIGVFGSVSTASSSGTPTFMVTNTTTTQAILSTALTIDTSEKTSLTAATPAVINTSYDGLTSGDEITVSVTVAGTDTKGGTVQLRIGKP